MRFFLVIFFALTFQKAFAEGKTCGQWIEDVAVPVAVYDHSHWWWQPEEKYSELLVTSKGQEINFVLATTERRPSDSQIERAQPEKLLGHFRRWKLQMERPPLNGEQYVMTGNSGHHLEESGFGDFAYDLVQLGGKNQLSYKGEGKKNSDFYVWNQEVYLPMSGRVFLVHRDFPDNPAELDYDSDAVPSYKPSNLVIVHLKGPIFLTLMHFKKGSIPAEIKRGQYLRAGTYLGRVGNSGVSYVPHLHLTFYYWDHVNERFWSIPSEFSRLSVSTLETEPLVKENYTPKSGDIIRASF